MRVALMHGKTAGYEDPSSHKEQRQREESRDGSITERCKAEDFKPTTFIDAREWEGYDLNQAVDRGALTSEQASSIMRLRAAVGKRKASEAQLENKGDGDRVLEVSREDMKPRCSSGESRQKRDNAVRPQQQYNHREEATSQHDVRPDGPQERIRMETSNATSLNSNRETALSRTAHFQVVQEDCLNEAQIAAMKTAARLKGTTYIGGPTDLEQGKAAAGVGALFHKDIAACEVTNPIEDYLDAVRSGRCNIVCFDAAWGHGCLRHSLRLDRCEERQL